MKPIKILWLLITILLSLLPACQSESGTVSTSPGSEKLTGPIRMLGVADGARQELDKQLIDEFVAETGIQVELIAGPESATDRLTEYQVYLSNESNDYDVYQIDVIWPGVLASHMVDLNSYLPEETQQHFPEIVQNNTVNGQLIGMPWYTDAGLLYYRTDLLEKYGFDGPPQTWDELEDMARTIQQGERANNPDFWGFVWQGNDYEGLTCDALEWQVSHGGGQIIGPDGAVQVNNPQAIAAFERAASWIDDISPPNVTIFQEEEARLTWQEGNAAFMRNWPYAYSLGQADGSPIRGQFEATLLPAGEGGQAATLGGWQLAVSKYSDHPQAAAQLVKFLTSPEIQKRRAIEGSYAPTIPELYEDTEVITVNPYYNELADLFAGGAVARPSAISGPAYPEVSFNYFTAVHSILTGQETAANALANLEDQLQDLVESDSAVGPVSLRMLGVADGVPYELDKQLIDEFVAETGIQVELIAGPESATDRLTEYQVYLSNESNDYDVYQIDVIWPGVLASHMVDLNSYLPEETQQHFPEIVQNNTVNGQLIGMPWYTDAGLLYYRTDLLEKYGFDGPPQTWDELEDMARTIQQGERANNPDFWGFVWQGNDYEGLTCDALEWQVSHGGGQIIGPDGAVQVNNPQAIAAFERAASWIDDISPPNVTIFQEEEARLTWQEGNAAFMRNWPYAYSLGQADGSPIRGQFEATLLPAGEGGQAATLGGWQLAVSKYSDHPQAAAQLVKFLTSPEIQKRRAIEGSYAPTIPELYEDTEVITANPYYNELADLFAGGAVARPSAISGPAYPEVSFNYFTAVHSILTGQETAANALANLEDQLQDLVE